MTTAFQIEVCIEHPGDAVVAQQAGATRIEINAALQLDGLTPTLGACRWLKANSQLPIIAMLRPHNNTFMLNPLDQQIVLADCQLLLASGVDGIAYGALNQRGTLNVEYMRQVAELCGDRELVCHRAFDRLADQRCGLEQLIDCGVRRVLTSGGAATAEQGIERLGQLMEWARDRIEILPGGGIGVNNAHRILELTGCNQLHGTFRHTSSSSGQRVPRFDPAQLRQICQYFL